MLLEGGRQRVPPELRVESAIRRRAHVHQKIHTLALQQLQEVRNRVIGMADGVDHDPDIVPEHRARKVGPEHEARTSGRTSDPGRVARISVPESIGPNIGSRKIGPQVSQSRRGARPWNIGDEPAEHADEA